ncbi:uncharacterized protein LOC117580968 [Drosophila guanche]|uniref:Uncharacterized protein n=1 Tax=Drosophila guanche TaxID=7266 RepID=A0A3B0J9F4_DROGU|nr:uncharacterized protein LOC117580968 [Drosophila guanche]SPP78857.1 Hypothetical predicted protein [Drosophila guanche]
MSKLSICLLLVVVLVVAIQADGDGRRPCEGRCTIRDLNSPRLLCVRDPRSNTCTKLRPCRLRELNCRRRDSGLAPLKASCTTRCRNILGGSGVSGQCAKRIRTQSPRSSDSKRVRECRRRKCIDDNIAGCWKDRQGACIVQTRCEAGRRNCVRQSNQWIRTSQWRCRGNVQGGGARMCRNQPIVIKD